MIQIIENKIIAELNERALYSDRLRQFHNLHSSYVDQPQVLLNVILKNSYIRPHSHYSETGPEYLFLINGTCVLVEFDDFGLVTRAHILTAQSSGAPQTNFGVKIHPNTWHTIYSVTESCTLLEVKAGPFAPEKSKVYPNWAPNEGSDSAYVYLINLIKTCNLLVKI